MADTEHTAEHSRPSAGQAQGAIDKPIAGSVTAWKKSINGSKVGRLRKWHRDFIAAYRNTGSMRAAAEKAGVEPATASRNINSNPQFAALVAQAQQDAREYIELHLQRMGVVGDAVPVWMQSKEQGRPVKVDTVYRKSVPALLAWLKANWPEKYGERITQELTGPQGTPLPAPVLAAPTQVIVNIPSNGRGDSQTELEQALQAQALPQPAKG